MAPALLAPVAPAAAALVAPRPRARGALVASPVGDWRPRSRSAWRPWRPWRRGAWPSRGGWGTGARPRWRPWRVALVAPWWRPVAAVVLAWRPWPAALVAPWWHARRPAPVCAAFRRPVGDWCPGGPNGRYRRHGALVAARPGGGGAYALPWRVAPRSVASRRTVWRWRFQVRPSGALLAPWRPGDTLMPWRPRGGVAVWRPGGGWRLQLPGPSCRAAGRRVSRLASPGGRARPTSSRSVRGRRRLRRVARGPRRPVAPRGARRC